MANLFVYDPEFNDLTEKSLAKGLFGIDRDSVVAADSWNNLAAEIRKRPVIDHLVFGFHGTDSGMAVGGDNRNLDDKSVTTLFAQTSRVGKVSFANCRVGNGPAKMRDFAKLFGAQSVTGYTWWLVTQVLTFKFPKGSEEPAIKAALAPLQGFTVEVLPTPSILKAQTRGAPRELKIVTLYGSADAQPASKFPFTMTDARTHKAYTLATKKSLTAAQVDDAQRVYDRTPLPDFELVTVTL